MITQERTSRTSIAGHPPPDTRITISEPQTDEEWRAAQALIREFFDWIVDGVGVRPEDVQESAANELSDLRSAYAPGRGVLLVARFDGARSEGARSEGTRSEGGIVATTGVLCIAPGVVELKRMFVRPEARGQGIAQALMREAMRRGRALGGRVMRLETHSTFMHPAYKMYQSYGFRPRPDYSGLVLAVPGVVAMERPIDVADPFVAA